MPLALSMSMAREMTSASTLASFAPNTSTPFWWNWRRRPAWGFS